MNEVYEEGRSTGWTQGYNAAHPVSITYPYTPYWYTTSTTPTTICVENNNSKEYTTTSSYVTANSILIGDEK